MTCRGQASTHLPQPTHLAGSTFAQKFSTCTAPYSQDFTHFMQPMQPILQTFVVCAPLSQFEQRTTACFLSGTKLMSPFGQAATHCEQPRHLCGSIDARPLQMLTAPYAHTAAQSPMPMQPKRQLVMPPARNVDAEQL